MNVKSAKFYHDIEGNVEYSKEIPTDLKKRSTENAELKRDISYGTALGYKKDTKYYDDMKKVYQKIFGDKRDKIETGSWEDAFDSLFSDNDQRKRAPFTFGTALGHGQSGGKSNYANSLNAKYKELFGKRGDIDDAIARWEAEQ